MLWTLTAIAAAVIVNIAVGMVWYSPLFFGKPWAQLKGFSKEHPPNARCGYVVSMVGAAVTAVALLLFFRLAAVGGVGGAVALSIMAWIGFVLPAKGIDASWGGQSWKLLAIDTGYLLVEFIAIGLTVWFIAPAGL